MPDPCGASHPGLTLPNPESRLHYSGARRPCGGRLAIMTRWGFIVILLALAAGNVAIAVVRADPTNALVGLLAAFLALEEASRVRVLGPAGLRIGAAVGGTATVVLWFLANRPAGGTGLAHLALAAGYAVEAVRLGRPPHARSNEEPS